MQPQHSSENLNRCHGCHSACARDLALSMLPAALQLLAPPDTSRSHLPCGWISALLLETVTPPGLRAVHNERCRVVVADCCVVGCSPATLDPRAPPRWSATWQSVVGTRCNTHAVGNTACTHTKHISTPRTHKGPNTTNIGTTAAHEHAASAARPVSRRRRQRLTDLATTLAESNVVTAFGTPESAQGQAM